MKENLFLARISDTVDLSLKTSVPHYFGFLTEEEIASAEIFLKKISCNFSFFGGYDDAQRKVLCCYPDWCENPDFPITPITVNFNSSYSLTHRDFLGSLMALGITRESVGDILTENGRAVIFLRNEVLSFVLTQIEKIGRVGVELEKGYKEPLPITKRLKSFSETVSSARLDCVVSAVCGVSRNSAVAAIEGARVLVNSVCTEKPTKNIVKGDSITVRGKGKFLIDSLEDRTKKGRIILKYSKYI